MTMLRLRTRIAIVVPITLALLGLVIAISVTHAGAKRAPHAALLAWPWNGVAHAVLADRALIDSRLDDAGRSARAALAYELLSPGALRTLAVVAEARGGKQPIEPMMKLGQRASRRDTLTNLWLLENAVRANDVPEVLRNYDIELRTSAASERILFPILDGALADPVIAKDFYPLIERRPPWTRSFLQFAFSSGAADRMLVPMVLRLSRDHAGLPDDLKRMYLARIVERGNVAGAARLYGAFAGKPILATGALGSSADWPPIDWEFRGDLGTGAGVDQDNSILFFSDGREDTVAQRVVNMAAGSHQLRATVRYATEAPGTLPELVVNCLPGNVRLAAQPLKPGTDIVAPVAVPDRQDCRYQTVALALPAVSEPGTVQLSGVLTGLRIEPSIGGR